jgi:hypothetical protein
MWLRRSRNREMARMQQEPGGGQGAAGTRRWPRSSKNQELAKKHQGTGRWPKSSRNQELSKKQ